MNNPLVSVCMITYNHDLYIEEAIRGVLQQEVDFSVEFIISNDASHDRTHQIITETLNDNSNGFNICYFNHTKNLGMMKNFSFALNKCKGKFVAICEGDDYWTDPLKLKKQLWFLKQNPECSFCFHTARVKEIKNNQWSVFPFGINQQILNTPQFFALETIPTCSVLFKNMALKSIAELDHKNGDFLLYCELLQKGKAGFLDEAMGVYRKHENGVSFNQGAKPYLFERIRELKIEQDFFQDPKIKKEIGTLYKRHILRYFQLYKNNDSFYRKYYLKKELYLNSSFRHSLVNRYKRRFKKKIYSLLEF